MRTGMLIAVLGAPALVAAQNPEKDVLSGSSAKGLQFSLQTGLPDETTHQELYDIMELPQLDANRLNNVPQGNNGPGQSGQEFGFANPMAAWSPTSKAGDSAEFWAPYMRSTPTINSAETAGEMVENYWWYLARDVRLEDYASNDIIEKAVRNMNTLSDFRGPGGVGDDENVTSATLFRGPTDGDKVGPYISQFLYLPVQQLVGSGPSEGTPVYRKDHKWQIPVEGYVAANTFMAKRDDAINVLSGNCPRDQEGGWCLEPEIQGERYIKTQRDLAWYVRYVYTYTSFYNAFIQIDQAPVQSAGMFSSNYDQEANPYVNGDTDGNNGQKQLAFIMYGSMDMHGALGDVARRAVKGAWYHKWRGAFRMRPEEYGLKLDNIRFSDDGATNPDGLHPDIVDNLDLLNDVAAANEEATGEPSWLFAQTYPEGAPTHPAYPSAHATIAGACSTLLKAIFEETEELYNPAQVGNPTYNVAKIPNEDGSELVDYDGDDILTLGGEIDKLASNVAYGRQPAGVHYRSDSEDGLEFGEAVAIEYLYELVLDHPEPTARFKFNKRNGEAVDITKENGIMVDGEAYVPLNTREPVELTGPANIPSGKDVLGGSFAKSIAHDRDTGLPNEDDHRALYDELEKAELNHTSLINVPQADGSSGLVNPSAAWSAQSQVGDSAEYWAPYMRPTPTVDSAETAGEMVENYWWALARDVKFTDYASDDVIAAAVENMNTLSDFRGPGGGSEDGSVTIDNLFRGPTPGDLVGPYISQFLYLPLQQYCYSAQLYQYDQKFSVPVEGPESDRMADRDSCMRSIEGNPRDGDPEQQPEPRYLVTQRDLGWWVRYVYTNSAFYNAAIQAFERPVWTAGGDTNKLDQDASPYRNGNTVSDDFMSFQVPFVTFGTMDAHGAIGAVARRAVKGAWYHKWRGSMRLRPEEYGLKLDNYRVTGENPDGLHSDILDNALLLERVAAHNDLVQEANGGINDEGNYLHAQMYPEGAPPHPAFPSAHATISGACSTILKAFFNESAVMYDPSLPPRNMTEREPANAAVMPTPDGSDLVGYLGDEVLTLGGEFDKLASNIAYGRQPAGVHYRSDSEDGLRFGEEVAIEYLLELVRDHPEPNAKFEFTRRSGEHISITPAGVVRGGVLDSSDDSLSTGAWVGIGFAIAVSVFVVGAVVNRVGRGNTNDVARDDPNTGYKRTLMENESPVV